MHQPRDVFWHEALAGADPMRQPEPMSSEDPVLLAYTSGTTGTPKGAPCTTTAAAREDRRGGALPDRHAVARRAALGDRHGLDHGPWECIRRARRRGTLVLYEGAPRLPDAGRLWQLVERHSITILGVSPTLIRALAQAGDGARPSADLSSLRMFGSTGEPWNPEPWHGCSTSSGRAAARSSTSPAAPRSARAFLSPTPLTPLKPGSLGKPCFGMSVEVWDATSGERLGPGEGVGELVCTSRGRARPAVLGEGGRERYSTPTILHLAGVWKHGDWASIDADGMWYLHGRKRRHHQRRRQADRSRRVRVDRRRPRERRGGRGDRRARPRQGRAGVGAVQIMAPASAPPIGCGSCSRTWSASGWARPSSPRACCSSSRCRRPQREDRAPRGACRRAGQGPGRHLERREPRLAARDRARSSSRSTTAPDPQHTTNPRPVVEGVSAWSVRRDPYPAQLAAARPRSCLMSFPPLRRTLLLAAALVSLLALAPSPASALTVTRQTPPAATRTRRSPTGRTRCKLPRFRARRKRWSPSPSAGGTIRSDYQRRVAQRHVAHRHAHARRRTGALRRSRLRSDDRAAAGGKRTYSFTAFDGVNRRRFNTSGATGSFGVAQDSGAGVAPSTSGWAGTGFVAIPATASGRRAARCRATTASIVDTTADVRRVRDVHVHRGVLVCIGDYVEHVQRP